MSRPPRIALIGWFGSGNFGNDGSFEAVLSFLRETEPEARLSCVCNDPSGIAARFGLPTARLRFRPRGILAIADNALLRAPSVLWNWIYALFTMARADLLLFPGTGIFDDYRNGPMGAPSQILRWCAAARLTGAKVAFVSVGAGPIMHPLSKWMMRLAAKLAHHRSYRDQESRDFMTGIGVDESASPILPDVAFLLPAPAHETRPAGAPVTVGLGVMAYHGWRSIEEGAPIYEDYIAKLARFADWLAERGCRIRLIAGETSDWRAVRELKARVGEKALAAIEPVAEMASLHGVMREIAQSDIVVASRFHVIVCALKLARPAASLSYGYKNDAVLAAAGLDGFFQNADAVDFALLTEHFTKLEADRVGYADIVRARVAEFVARLRAPGALVPARLLRR